MTRRRDHRPISHEVTAPQQWRPSSYFTRLLPIEGQPGSLKAVPARRQDCDHCGEELRPASFADVNYRSCPNACMSTWDEARNDYHANLDPDPPPTFDVQGRF